MPPVLSADRVTKQFAVGGGQRIVAIQDLSLAVYEGEFVCILGASGCGKSTLLNIFAGFLRPSAGRVLLHGEPILGIEPRCGMVFQSYALFPWKTVRGNVEFGLKMQGVAAAERRRRAYQFIELVKLSGFEDRYPGELSGGMQQRVSLARILAADPEVLLMDEPFGALDEALILADRIIVMSARPGRVKAELRNTLPRPRHVDIQLSPDYARLKSTVWSQVEQELLRQTEAADSVA